MNVIEKEPMPADLHQENVHTVVPNVSNIKTEPFLNNLQDVNVYQNKLCNLEPILNVSDVKKEVIPTCLSHENAYQEVCSMPSILNDSYSIKKEKNLNDLTQQDVCNVTSTMNIVNKEIMPVYNQNFNLQFCTINPSLNTSCVTTEIIPIDLSSINVDTEMCNVSSSLNASCIKNETTDLPHQDTVASTPSIVKKEIISTGRPHEHSKPQVCELEPALNTSHVSKETFLTEQPLMKVYSELYSTSSTLNTRTDETFYPELYNNASIQCYKDNSPSEKDTRTNASIQCYKDHVLPENGIASNASNHYHTHLVLAKTEARLFKCDRCHRKYRQLSGLKKHLDAHSEDRYKTRSVKTTEKAVINAETHQCSMCKKEFSHKSSLFRHFLIHTDEKPHECVVCKKKFRDRSNLNDHLIIHTGEKPHECLVCKKKFSRKIHLNNHLLIHTGERAFECMVCKKRFRHKAHLNKHSLLHNR